MSETLFSAHVQLPLAEELRPRRISDVIGQNHLLAPTGPIGRMIAAKRLTSFILWGPPGVGKTTISRLVAAEVGYRFIQLSAVSTGITDLRKTIFEAARLQSTAGPSIVVFVDELHRFSRPVQDALLPAIEDGTIVLIGATPENPSFSLVAALLSRAKVYTLSRLGIDDLSIVVGRVEAHLGLTLPLTVEAKAALIAMADGDARYLIGMCEDIATSGSLEQMDTEALARLVQQRAPLYDRGHEEHFNLLSCFHKSLRGIDPLSRQGVCTTQSRSEQPERRRLDGTSPPAKNVWRPLRRSRPVRSCARPRVRPARDIRLIERERSSSASGGSPLTRHLLRFRA